jgi:hypothetical protein
MIQICLTQGNALNKSSILPQLVELGVSEGLEQKKNCKLWSCLFKNKKVAEQAYVLNKFMTVGG